MQIPLLLHLDCSLYTALSHTWGSSPDYKEILIDSAQLRNLVWFLYFMHLLYSSQIFYVDAISINQGKSEEQNHQVLFMKDIYIDLQSVPAGLLRHTVAATGL